MEELPPEKALERRFRKKAKKIEALLLEIELIKEQIKQIKSHVAERLPGHLRRLPVNKLERLFGKLYWASEGLAWSVVTAFRSVLPGQTIGKEKYFDFACEICQTTMSVSVTSWADYKHKRPTKSLQRQQWPRIKCPECTEKCETQDQRSRAKIDAWWQEREQRVQTLRSMPYADYLNTTHWQELRQRKLKQAYYRCQLCNAKDQLHVHHRTYERRGYEWLADLIVLCKFCHQKFHDILATEDP